MEIQRFAKPYLARFIWHRWLVGGVCRKYAYSNHPHTRSTDGIYWTQDDNDYCIGTTCLQKLKQENWN